jgi:hypothetical protein
MNEDVLRAVIREAIARHLGAAPAGLPLADPSAPSTMRPAPVHVSHLRFVLPLADGPCMVEPHVGCTHCGFCESLGH